jgi:hypothetical protein
MAQVIGLKTKSGTRARVAALTGAVDMGLIPVKALRKH